MEIQVLGIGNAFTSRYYNTSFLIRSRQLVLVDCPQGLFGMLREYGIDPARIDKVVVTHIHGDHIAGLETLLLWKRYVTQSRVTICTGRPVWEALKSRFFPSFSATFTPDLTQIIETELEEYADFQELTEDGENHLDEDVKIEFRYNWHPTPTLGLKLISRFGAVGISGDTCYRPSLLKSLFERGVLEADRYEKLAGDWLWTSDLVYHEVERAEGGAHTSESELLALPPEIRQKMRLIHLADDFNNSSLALAEEGETVKFIAPGKVRISKPGK
ncbi:MAG TPA: MBL fold metallo-hydrolase [Acidobacteriota bacterium]|nr:MBL fold metallo-hydrolase [Acidobacteriota bacterium]